jgi:hypothetical protein
MQKFTAGAATAGLVATVLLAAGTQMPALSKHARHHHHAKHAAAKHATKHAATKHAAKPAAAPKAAAKPAEAPKNDAALVAKGQELTARCRCHGPDLNGREGRTPSLHASGALAQYNEDTFVRLMTQGVDEEGKPIGPPMNNIKLEAADAKAVYAYLKTLK